MKTPLVLPYERKDEFKQKYGKNLWWNAKEKAWTWEAGVKASVAEPGQVPADTRKKGFLNRLKGLFRWVHQIDHRVDIS
jgi:hypothetical protein